MQNCLNKKNECTDVRKVEIYSRDKKRKQIKKERMDPMKEGLTERKKQPHKSGKKERNKDGISAGQT